MNVTHSARGLCRRIVDFILPPVCASCKNFLDEEKILCMTCRYLIKPVVSRTIEITATQEMRVFAIGFYNAPLTYMILSKSWSNRLGAVQLGELLWEMTYIRNIECDLMVPVPLHWTRFAWRGYNQAAEIAHVLSKKNSKPVMHLLKRVRRTPFQSHMERDLRHDNVKDVFELTISDRAHYKDKHILIVDDVMTSGATLKAVAKELLKLRPASLTAIVVARV